ncbi:MULTISPECIES: site-specific integrase [unclassified Sphingomonas]|uniref:tyrosine-type recombinase/integrase n=1 Tax=unclassified Sphingomonas TaxID=196159 RepID=UPI00226A0059|nr:MULTISPECIES: site-specific integrase [unclassified Sphingomonas]
MASVSKRSWTYNGVRKDAWAVRYFDDTGARRSKQCDTKKEADAFKRKIEREVEDGTLVGPSASLTVEEVCKRYITDAERRESRGEISLLHVIKVGRFIRLHIVPTIGRVVFKDLRAADVDKLHHHLSTKMQPHCARQVLGFLATVEKFANRHRYCLTNPVRAALSGVRAAPQPRIREFTLDEASAVLRTVLEKRENRKIRHAAMFACLVHMSACCGLRIGEMLALPWGNVDLDRATLTVRHSLNALLEIKGPKSRAGNREVPMPAHLVAMLRTWHDAHAMPNEWDLVFTTTAGKKVFNRNVNRAWSDLLRDAGVLVAGDPHHFHALRHFAGSWWLHNGLAIADVSRLMGHASPAITMGIYAHVISKPEDRHSALTAMGAKLAAIPDARVTQIAA